MQFAVLTICAWRVRFDPNVDRIFFRLLIFMDSHCRLACRRCRGLHRTNHQNYECKNVTAIYSNWVRAFEWNVSKIFAGKWAHACSERWWRWRSAMKRRISAAGFDRKRNHHHCRIDRLQKRGERCITVSGAKRFENKTSLLKYKVQCDETVSDSNACLRIQLRHCGGDNGSHYLGDNLITMNDDGACFTLSFLLSLSPSPSLLLSLPLSHPQKLTL